MFVAMGLSAVFPVLDGLATYGWEQMQHQIGLFWLMLQGALYIFGAGLYAVSSSRHPSENFVLTFLCRLDGLRNGVQGSTTWLAAVISSSTFWWSLPPLRILLAF